MNIVSAGIIKKDGKILIAKRKIGKCLEALWEFPGGKIEEGETIEECLIREIKEELDLDIEVLDFVCCTEFFCGKKGIKLMAFMAKYLSGELVLNDHSEVLWVEIEELKNYEFVKADKVIVEAILNRI